MREKSRRSYEVSTLSIDGFKAGDLNENRQYL